ncbi:MAG: glycoside hydrolase family 2 protein [Clostridia bacterium]|nr:glycoside hydrolase family 2 protein [Clostridia bacterium]
MKREHILLQSGWLFALGSEKPSESAFQPVQIPHDWAVSRPIDPLASLDMAQGWFNRKEVGWYQNTVTIREKWPGRRYMLCLDGIWECSDIWINGQHMGGHRYGYTPFRLDVTEAVNAGENTLLIRVDNTREPADRWYSGCGIYRPVHWMELDETHLDEARIEVQVSLDGDDAVVSIRTGMKELVNARLTAPDGMPAAEACGSELICLRVKSPVLWSAEMPALYRLTMSLQDGDSIEMHIGLRSVQIGENGLLVNGIPVKLHGVCLHQDMGCLGIAATKEMWKDRLEKLKAIGCNALRLAHHMHSSEMLDLCDEMGFYVYSECFDKWHGGLYGRYFDSDWQTDLDAMIMRDRNRPSVIIWGVGNEVENQGLKSMVDTLSMLTDRVRALDSTRPVTYAMNPHFKRPGKQIDFSRVKDIQQLVDEADDREIEDMDERLACISAIAEHVDIISCNYQEQWFDDIHRAIPGKPILSTEAYPFFVGHHESMQNYTERVPALIPEAFPWVLGSFVWSGYDYLGESMGWPSKGWTGSLFRMDGTPRCSAYILKSHWGRTPMVHISILDNALGDEYTKSHWANPPYEDVWDFPDLHQGVLPFLITTNCERVEIHIAGRIFHPPLPAAQTDGRLTGFVPWAPGKIEVFGFNGETCVCRHALYTPGVPAALEVTSMSDRIVKPGEEMLLRAQIVDAEGHPCIRDTRPVSFDVQGDAEILATDNCNLMETTPYSSRQMPAWHGAVSAVVRRTGPRNVRIRACAAGLSDGEAEWESLEMD